jgi:predicted nucleotidyltransferase
MKGVPDDLVPHPRYGSGPIWTSLRVPERWRRFWRYRSERAIEGTAVKADTGKQQFACVQPQYYLDTICTCVDCRRKFIFFALEQKHWFEELGFKLDAWAVRCPECRPKEREPRRRRTRFSRAVVRKDLTDEELATLASDCAYLVRDGSLKKLEKAYSIRKRLRAQLPDCPELHELEEALAIRAGEAKPPASSFEKIAMPGRHWSDADEDVREFLTLCVSAFEEELGAGIVGVYLHGSLAFGCYNRARSDLDLLVVVQEPLSRTERLAFLRRCADLSHANPTPGDIELSVVLLPHVQEFSHPLPYEAHYSRDFNAAIRTGAIDTASGKTDADIAAHCTVVRARGIALLGPPPAEVFGPVPWSAYIASITEDFNWIASEEHLMDNPVYGILNMCRVEMTIRLGPPTVVSKEEAGEWMMSRTHAAHRDLLRLALAVYRGEREEPAHWNKEQMQAFRCSICISLEFHERFKPWR